MTSQRQVQIFPGAPALCDSVAARLIGTVSSTLESQEIAHLNLTGGSVGIGVLRSLAASPAVSAIDWSRVHLWFGDERWVPRDDPERNERQAREALIDSLDIPAANIHSYPAPEEGTDLDAAAELAAAELARWATAGDLGPRFDITLLGVGPDGHIASLFPGREGIRVKDRAVIAVRNSPKPPPERLSMTRPVLNGSQRVWLVLAGADKASAIGLALAGAEYVDVPVAGAKGVTQTVFFVDEAAAAEVPESLTQPSDEFHSLARPSTRP